MNEFFAALGIHPQDVMAGFVGGVARILMPPYMGAWSALTTVLLGAITAAYFTDVIAAMVGDKINRGAVGFIVGLGAMVICQGLIGLVAKMKFPGGRQDAT